MNERELTPDGPENRSLDPVTDPERWEGLVARINQAAAPMLERRRPASLWRTLSTWQRPVAWGSAGLVAAAALALLLLPPVASDATTE
ncbi:MAG: hypothetical protein HKO53_07510, partial [Gemmatimonadetes bacterium]|nr:hypothetical protein [Gemmatimonadota bacterium]